MNGLYLQVPPPLALGTVQLKDGAAVKGFICEGHVAEVRCPLWRNAFVSPAYTLHGNSCMQPRQQAAMSFCSSSSASWRCALQGGPGVEDITHHGGWVTYIASKPSSTSEE